MRGRAPARVLVGIAALALVGLLLVQAVALSGAPRNSAFEEDARGLSQLAQLGSGEGIRTESLAAGPHALDAVENPSKAVFLVAGVERPYTSGEVAAIQAFVARGGTALVADDFGAGDAVAAGYGVTFDKRPLRDASFHLNVSLVAVNATLGAQNLSFITNVPASLGSAPGANVTVLAESGPDSYIDENQDGIEDTGDIKGPFAVLVSVAAGQGRILFASDPGFLANDLAQDNAPFLKAFLGSLLPEGGTLVVDESRHAQGPFGGFLGALLAGDQQATSEPVLAVLTVIVALGLVGLTWLAFDPPEDITAHASTLDAPAHELTEASARERLRRLARRAVSGQANMNVDDAASATPEQLATLATDPAVKELLLGKATKEPLGDLLARVRRIGTRGAQPSSPPPSQPGGGR